MNVGDSHSFRVRARAFWNDSGVDLVEGASYSFCARGIWVDFYVPCGPDGYGGMFFQRPWLCRRRKPEANWFALCGTLDQDEQTAFVIGKKVLYPAKTDGRLYCYANDVPGWYWNNAGSVRVTVTRVS